MRATLSSHTHTPARARTTKARVPLWARFMAWLASRKRRRNPYSSGYSSEYNVKHVPSPAEIALAGGVVAANTSRAFNVARRIRTGRIEAEGVGSLGTVDPGLGCGQGPGWGEPIAGLGQGGAFGGFKQSGIGREWGRHGMEDFTEVKSISWT